MHEVRFHVRWPDGSREACVSPSPVVRKYLAAGQHYLLDEFVSLSRTALGLASERVRECYGFPCGRAEAQIARIVEATRRQEPGTVYVESFED